LISHRAEKIFTSRDDGRIVIDEIAGYLVAMTGAVPGVGSVITGFFLFRLFDVFKPWPGSMIDRKLGGGAGIVLDDVAAGLYACMVLHGLMYLWPVLGRSVW